MAVTVPEIDAALQADPEFQQADASVQRKWRANALKDAGLSTQARTEPSAPTSMGVIDVAAGLAPPGMAEQIGSFVKPSILPTVGSIGVPAAATALLGPANAPFVPLEAGIGSGLGEAANQAMGITEPSLAQIGLSAAVPTVLGYGSQAVRAGQQFFGAKGAETLNQLAPEEARSVIGALPRQESKPLFELAAKQGVTIPAEKTKNLMTSILSDPNIPSAEKKAFRKVLKDTGVEEFLAENLAGLNPARMQRVLAATGKLQKSAEGYEGGHLKQLFGTLKEDLETASRSVGSPIILKQARDAFKRESVMTELDDAINAAFFIKKGQGASGEFSANKVLNALRDQNDDIGKFFNQAFTKAERKDVTDLFKFLNTLPALGPGAGQQFGSGRAIAKTLGPIAAGSGAGFAMGGPAGSGIGAAAGAILPPVADTGKMMLQAWRMPGGRTLIKSLLSNSDGALTPQVLTTLGAFVSGQAASGIDPNTMSPVMSQPTGSLTPPGMTVRPFALAQ